MRTVVVTDPPRASADDAAALGEFGVATVHEALGRVGYLGPEFRPAWPGARAGGTAVTVLCWPGDNLMIHVAVEQCRAGDVLIVATTSPSTDGLFGELFATALRYRGVRGVVLGCGVRDVAYLQKIGFPVFGLGIVPSTSVGHYRFGGSNVPIVCDGVPVNAGDIIAADNEGVVAIPRASAAEVLKLAREMDFKEHSMYATIEKLKSIVEAVKQFGRI